MDKNKCPFLIFVLLFVLKKVKKLLLVTYGLNPFLRLKIYLAKLWSRFFDLKIAQKSPKNRIFVDLGIFLCKYFYTDK